ncbi:MAG: sigma-70 family RNA polymerase sigma factor [Sphingobacteriaceae bacterium]|nr:MAG: sigma-70 family RNA polymerase sigma factor [Sphingobacteriaceae bacterium]
MEKEFLKSVNEHQGILFKICRMYCTDNDDVNDLFQDMLLQLWQAWPSFKGASKLTTWMYRICLNTAIARLRKSSRSPAVQILTEAQYGMPDAGPQRLDILFDSELQVAIDSLSRIDKALIMLYLDEKSYKEIAEIMDMTESNVGVKLNRIKNKLKERMGA